MGESFYEVREYREYLYFTSLGKDCLSSGVDVGPGALPRAAVLKLMEEINVDHSSVQYTVWLESIQSWGKQFPIPNSSKSSVVGASLPVQEITISMDMNSINSSDPKSVIIKQIQQEAAVNNARQLISVRPFPHFSNLSILLLKRLTSPTRKWTSTALTNAYLYPAAHYRRKKKHASRRAWRNTCRFGILSAGNTSHGYRRVRRVEKGKWRGLGCDQRRF